LPLGVGFDPTKKNKGGPSHAVQGGGGKKKRNGTGKKKGLAEKKLIEGNRGIKMHGASR